MLKEQHGALTAGLFDEPVKVTNPVKVQDLTFRDGHQSLFATRGRTEDFLPIAEEMDTGETFWPVGYLFLLSDEAREHRGHDPRQPRGSPTARRWHRSERQVARPADGPPHAGRPVHRHQVLQPGPEAAGVRAQQTRRIESSVDLTQ